MKKKIIHTQGTFGETFETEEIVEDELDDAEPFEIDEIKKIDNSEIKEKETKEVDNLEIKKEETEKDILLLTEEIPKQNLIQTIEKPNLDVEQVSKLNKQVDELKKRNSMLRDNLNEISKALSQKNGDVVIIYFVLPYFLY